MRGALPDRCARINLQPTRWAATACTWRGKPGCAHGVDTSRPKLPEQAARLRRKPRLVVLCFLPRVLLRATSCPKPRVVKVPRTLAHVLFPASSTRGSHCLLCCFKKPGCSCCETAITMSLATWIVLSASHLLHALCGPTSAPRLVPCGALPAILRGFLPRDFEAVVEDDLLKASTHRRLPRYCLLGCCSKK